RSVPLRGGLLEGADVHGLHQVRLCAVHRPVLRGRGGGLEWFLVAHTRLGHEADRLGEAAPVAGEVAIHSLRCARARGSLPGGHRVLWRTGGSGWITRIWLLPVLSRGTL